MYNKTLRQKIKNFLANPSADVFGNLKETSDDLSLSMILAYQGLLEQDDTLIDTYFSQEEIDVLCLKTDEIKQRIKSELAREEIELLVLADALIVILHQDDYYGKDSTYWTNMFDTWKDIHDSTIGKSSKIAFEIMYSLAEKDEQEIDCSQRLWENNQNNCFVIKGNEN